ncbi:hypothetical protein CDAR_1581 [Caerostris darwini]|uniref:Uncharacterized protein n=1 Tax=Caerostris darwini TaxID=1538125 RepID=A0AAV4R6R0_9ARAC|nr:hypothetical protein CDAR_1581 [Caerostris darwini]
MVWNDNFIFMKQKSINCFLILYIVSVNQGSPNFPALGPYCLLQSYELKFLMYYFKKKPSYQRALLYLDTRNNSILCRLICPIPHKENVSISCVNSINGSIALKDFQEKEAFMNNFKLLANPRSYELKFLKPHSPKASLNLLLNIWKEIPLATMANLVESMPSVKLDISNGKENIRISCVNSIHKTDILVYNEEQFVCGCTDNCQIVPVDDIKKHYY